jgi:hypothetical protein
MSDWALGGLVLAMFIAGFNIGQDFKYKKWILKKNKKYTYWISCFYSVKGVGSVGGWASNFDSEMNSSQLQVFREKQIKNLKNQFKTTDVEFEIIDFKRLKD